MPGLNSFFPTIRCQERDISSSSAGSMENCWALLRNRLTELKELRFIMFEANAMDANHSSLLERYTL